MMHRMPYELLPCDLVIEIFARLPVVSLLRFKSVCKSWYSLITSDSFITKHLSNCKKKLYMRLYDTNDKKERYAICQYDEQFGDEGSELDFPFTSSSFAGLRMVGSCNGILCMREDSRARQCPIIVWNPSVRKSVILAAPRIPEMLVVGFRAHPTTHEYMLVVGFGAHPTTHEYRVVIIVDPKYPYQPDSQPLVELYTQGTGSWRGLGSIFPPYCFIYFGASQAFVNGAVNWIAVGQRYQPLIVSFDMSAETFSVMMLPPALADQKLGSLSITLFRESLAVLCTNIRQRDKGDCCIWVMKEYGVSESWTKLFCFKLDPPVFLKRTLGFSKHGEVLLLTIDNHLLSYDIGTKALVDTGFRGRPNAFHYEPFVESLVSVESKNGVLDGQLNPL